MSGISFPHNLTVHIDVAGAFLFDKDRTPEQLAQILLSREIYDVWDGKSRTSYWEFAKRCMFPGEDKTSRRNMEVYLSQSLGHLKSRMKMSPSLMKEAQKKAAMLLEKINGSYFFSSFHNFFSALKNDNNLGQQHTVIFVISKNDFKSAQSTLRELYPDISFSHAIFWKQGTELQVLAPPDSTSDPNRMQQIFDRCRYWLVQDNSSITPFPCSANPERIYCLLGSKKKGEKNAIEIDYTEALQNENYFSQIIPKRETKPAPLRESNRGWQAGILSAAMLFLFARIFPRNEIKREPAPVRRSHCRSQITMLAIAILATTYFLPNPLKIEPHTYGL